MTAFDHAGNRVLEMRRILLVEDEKDIIENLSAILRSEGFQVRAEEGQAEALRAVEEESL